MMQRLHPGLFAVLGLLLITTITGLQPAEAADLVAQVESKYTKTLAGLNQQLEANRSKTLKAYAGALEKITASLKQKSDLEGILLVRKEKERLSQTRDLQEQDVTTDLDMLANLQRKVIARLKKYQGEYSERVVGLTHSYVRTLDDLQNRLVKGNHIDDAIALKNRAAQVMGQEPYLTAKVRLDIQRAAQEAARAEAREKAAALKEKQKALMTSASRGKQVDDDTRTEAILYLGGTPPPVLRGARRENLLHTGNESRAASARMSGVVNVLSSKAESRADESGGYYNKWVGKRIIPRISLSSGPKPIKSSTMIIQYFAKGSGSDRKEVHKETVKLPPMDATQTIIIDAVGQSIYSDYLHVHPDGYKHSVSSSSYSSGGRRVTGEYGGFVISVFEEDGSLVFQRCTQNSLAQYAPRP